MNQPTTPVEQVVQFSCAGQPVFGIKHTPPGAVAKQPKTGVIFINAGVRSRRGPKRLYVRFARRLSQAGYHVLRFDLPGIGDSPGELKDVSAYKKKFLDCTDSTVSAIDYFKKVDGVERIAVVGLCGGAYSALAASAVERRIDWLVLTSLPVQDLSDMSEKAMSDINTHSYFSKIFAWRAWYKFLTGKSHYVWMLRAAARLLTGRYRRPELDPALWAATAELFATGRKALFLYGD
ncbi:MAG: alpha/beta fold hydrolase, partial [Thermoguttaceae bacterium]